MRQVILNAAGFTCSTIQPGSVERLRVRDIGWRYGVLSKNRNLQRFYFH